MAETATALAGGRAAFQGRAWQECWRLFSAADSESPLQADDLVLLALSAYLSGHDRDSADALARAFHAYVDDGRMPDAARAAFWLAFMLLNTGELARGNGWATRARRVVDQHCPGGAEDGLLTTLDAHRLVESGQPAAGLALAEAARERGEATGDPDLRVLAHITSAGALLELQRGPDALERLDEVMAALTADEVTPTLAGLAYCVVISVCMRLSDLRRAREGTAALSTWCDGQPGLVPYRGQCQVHRAQIMMLQGAWTDAFEETMTACRSLEQPAVGEAYYLLGELHRLRGEFEQSEEAFRQANSWGRRPEPGLVRLRVAQGRLDTAVATIRRLLGEEHSGLDRAEVLVVGVEVMVAAGDLATARAACEKLTRLEATGDSPLLAAFTARATGTVLLAAGRAGEAVDVLRRGWRTWQELRLPYDAARTRVLIGRCLRELGDEDSALMELDAARSTFERLGAVPDLRAVDALAPGPSASRDGLTPREVEVIRLVASGRTNRVVADELFLSEKTVARHLSNIYLKLDISSRTAATAYAYDHGLV